jgi:hypothetical protein
MVDPFSFLAAARLIEPGCLPQIGGRLRRQPGQRKQY